MKEMITIDSSPQAVVIGNGDFPMHRIPLSLIDGEAFKVCCDGAANCFLRSGRVPDRIVGDGDSLLEANKVKYASRVRFNPDQETNDQTKAVTYLKEKGIKSIAIVAATGKREDHTLGNISLLVEYLRMGLDVRMYTDYGVFIPVSGDCRCEVLPGSQVSIISFGTQGMTAEGLVYPLRDFQNWWQGTLNEVAYSPFSIHCEGEYILFLNYPEEK